MIREEDNAMKKFKNSIRSLTIINAKNFIVRGAGKAKDFKRKQDD